MLQNYAWVIDPGKVQDGSIDFNVTVWNVHWCNFRFHTVTDI